MITEREADIFYLAITASMADQTNAMSSKPIWLSKRIVKAL